MHFIRCSSYSSLHHLKDLQLSYISYTDNDPYLTSRSGRKRKFPIRVCTCTAHFVRTHRELHEASYYVHFVQPISNTSLVTTQPTDNFTISIGLISMKIWVCLFEI